MYDIAGHRTGGGSPDWLAAAQTPNASAAAVRRVLDAGATVIGKTICDEFFFSVTGANAHYGTPANPRAAGRLPGGSSSGSAAATAAGACDFALGSDTGGSVRVPASFCGVFGIRPTHGRIDLSGAMAMASSLDVAGWFAGGPGVFRKIVGAPVVIRFQEPLKPQVFDFWVQSTFGRQRNRFRLWGHPIRLGPTKVHVYGLDCHLWHPLFLELTARGCTAIIPSGTCGNTVHRLVTNVQRYLDPGAEVYIGDTPYRKMVEESSRTVEYASTS